MWMWAIQIFYIASKSKFQQARFAIDISQVIWFTLLWPYVDLIMFWHFIAYLQLWISRSNGHFP